MKLYERVRPGTVVMVIGHYSNGLNEHPAMVTRTYTDVSDPLLFAANLTVFPDFAQPFVAARVTVLSKRPTEPPPPGSFVCYPREV